MADSLFNALIARQMGPHDTLTPEVQDQLARQEQATWSPGRRRIVGGVEGMGSFVKGLGTGGDTTNPNWRPGYAEGVGAMLASLPPLKGAEAIPGLFSKLNRAMESMPSKSKAMSILNQLKKFVTPAELKVRGVEDFLTKKGQTIVTLDELKEATKGIQPIDVTKLRGGDVKWERYKMEGGIPGTYREDIIQQNPLPPSGSKEAIQAARKAWNAARHVRNQLRVKYGDYLFPQPRYGEGRFIAPGGKITQVQPGEVISEALSDARMKARMYPTYDEEDLMHVAPKKAWDRLFDLRANSDPQFLDPHFHQPNPIATVRYQEMPGPTGIVRNLENVQSKWHQNYADPSYAGQIKVAPDPSFADNRWVDLALKEQLLDIANQPHIKGISITPGQVAHDRGETAGKYINDEVLPKRLRKLLEPFGVKSTQTTKAVPVEAPDFFGSYELGDPTASWGVSETFTVPGSTRRVYKDAPAVVSAYPRIDASIPRYLDVPETARLSKLQDILMKQVSKRPQQFMDVPDGPLTFLLSDQVKSQIKEKGFPILALLASMRQRSNKEGQ